MIKALPALCGLIASTIPALAENPFTGELLKEACTATGQASMACSYYLYGFEQGALSPLYTSHGNSLCIPLSASPDQMKELVVTVLKHHPEFLKQGSHLAVAAALHEAFPCTE